MTRSLLPGLALLTFVVPALAADALTWEGAPPTVYALEV